MILVAFDTATEALAIGLGRWADGRGEVLGSRDLLAPRSANTRLLAELADLLSEHGMSAADIGAVVVGRGPGSFTGARIGVATAKGLAHGRAVPLFGVGTLDAVARRFATHEGLLGVVGDAMRAEVYPALFRASDGRLERLSADVVAGPVETAERWASETEGPLLLAGNGLAKHADAFAAALGERAVFASEDTWLPTGAALLSEAFATCELDHAPHPGTLLPVYTRLSDAEEAERRRAAQGSACAALPDSGVAGPGAEGPR